MADKCRLWTPIANALDVYRRRVLADPKATYEHIWRLIHIHESLVVTLGSGLATRLLILWKNDVENKRRLEHLRSMVTGLSEPSRDVVSEGRTGGYCLGGHIQAWIDLLQHFGKVETTPDCLFCRGVGDYLAETAPEKSLAFLGAWKRLAPVPPVYIGNLSRVKRFDAINSLRNKLAHVPLPNRVLNELHRGLRREVFYELSVDAYDKADDDLEDFRTVNWHKPLKGLIKTKGFAVTGSDTRRDVSLAEEVGGVYIQPEVASGESWSAEPFFSLDGECKVLLLFRVPDEIDGASDCYRGEYHRFAAEFEPVNGKDIEARVMESWFPGLHSDRVMSAPEGHREKGEVEGRAIEEDDLDKLRADAEDAYHSRDYARAIVAFEKLAKQADKSRYNDVAKLHHGSSLWRFGYANDGLKTERTKTIQTAIEVLEEATCHADVRYAARAWYEKSKAYHKLWKFSGDGYFGEAYQAAEEAARLDYQMAYITWIERLDDEKRQLG